MIAGNGRFPLLALETARRLGDEVVAIGIQEEASPEIEQFAARCYWISLGQLSRLIEILRGLAHHDSSFWFDGSASQICVDCQWETKFIGNRSLFKVGDKTEAAHSRPRSPRRL